eukprot:gene4762-5941_t
MTDNQMIRIKCILNDDIRIIKVNPSISYQELLNQLESDFNEPVTVYQYEDFEKDRITVRNKSDLTEALSMCLELKSKHPNEIITIRFFLKSLTNNSNISHHSNNSNGSNGSIGNFMNLLNNSHNNNNSNGNNNQHSLSPQSSAIFNLNHNSNSNKSGGINLPRPSSPIVNNNNNNNLNNNNSNSPNLMNNNNNNQINNFNQQRDDLRFTTLILNEHEELKNLQSIKWQKGQILGRGGYGAVYLGLNTDNGELFAVKQLDIVDSVNDSKLRNIIMSFSREIEVMKSLKHENIVRYLGTCLDSTHLNVFLEYVPGGSISSLLARFGPFSENTPYWMAPEVIKQTGHGRSSDIWSLGCVLIEMATGQPPWSNITELTAVMYHIVSSNSTPPIPANLSADAHDFLSLCFKRDPKERPDANTLLKHPFITSLDTSGGHPSSHELSLLMPSAPRYRFSTQVRLPTTSISSIPRVLLIHIFKYLSPPSSISIGLVCKQWKNIFDDEDLWVKYCLHNGINHKDQNLLTWKSTFINVLKEKKLWFSNKIYQTTLKGHSKCIYCIKLVDQYILSGGDDKKLKVWDSTSKKGKHLFSLKGHTGSVKSVDCQSNFARIFTSSSDFTARIWNVKTKKSLFTYTGHHEAVTSINFLGDVEGKVLTSSLDKTLQIWDAETGSTLSTMTGHTKGIYGVRYEKNSVVGSGGVAVSVSADWTARVWDTRTSQSVRIFNEHEDDVTCVSIYDSKVVTGSGDGTIRLWDLGTGKTISTFIPQETQEKLWVWCLQMDQYKLISSGKGGVIRIWDLYNNQSCRTIGGHHETVFSLNFKDSKLVTCSKDKFVKLWSFDDSIQNNNNSHHNSILSRLSSSTNLNDQKK